MGKFLSPFTVLLLFSTLVPDVRQYGFDRLELFLLPLCFFHVFRKTLYLD